MTSTNLQTCQATHHTASCKKTGNLLDLTYFQKTVPRLATSVARRLYFLRQRNYSIGWIIPLPRERGPLKSRKGPAARVSSRALSDPDTKRFVIGDVRSARVGIGNWRALLQLVSSPCQISSCSTVCPPTNIHRGPKKSEPLLTHQFNHRFVPDFATKTALQNQSTKPRFIG